MAVDHRGVAEDVARPGFEGVSRGCHGVKVTVRRRWRARPQREIAMSTRVGPARARIWRASSKPKGSLVTGARSASTCGVGSIALSGPAMQEAYAVLAAVVIVFADATAPMDGCDKAITTVPRACPMSDSTDGFKGSGQRVRPVDHRCDLSSLDELLEDVQVGWVLGLDGWAALLAHEHGNDGCLDHAPELAVRVSIRIPSTAPNPASLPTVARPRVDGPVRPVGRSGSGCRTCRRRRPSSPDPSRSAVG